MHHIHCVNSIKIEDFFIYYYFLPIFKDYIGSFKEMISWKTYSRFSIPLLSLFNPQFLPPFSIINFQLFVCIATERTHEKKRSRFASINNQHESLFKLKKNNFLILPKRCLLEDKLLLKLKKKVFEIFSLKHNKSKKSKNQISFCYN